MRDAVKTADEGRPVTIGRTLMTPRESAAVLVPLFRHEPSEVFALLLRSTRQSVIAYHEVGRGMLDTVLVTPRYVFRAAIHVNAAAVIVAHSHPSGDPTPSRDDFELTSRLTAAGVLLGIELLDHIVVGDGRYVSVKAIGRL